jgi:hypothetical protein
MYPGIGIGLPTVNFSQIRFATGVPCRGRHHWAHKFRNHYLSGYVILL